MKVLLDHCVPNDLAPLLTPHEVATAYQQGWNDLQNGALLRAAGGVFGCLLTLDRGFRHQQNIRVLPLPVVQIVAVNNRVTSIEPLIPRILALLEQPLQNVLYVVSNDATLQVTE